MVVSLYYKDYTEVRDMTNIIHTLLSSVLITIPEFMFMIIVTFKFMKRTDMLDLYDLKNNLISLSVITIPPALLYDILNYILKSSSLFNRIIVFTFLYIILVYMLKQKDRKRELTYQFLKSKSVGYLIVSLFLALAIEAISFPVILHLVNKTIEEIKADFYLILICSSAPRIIDIIIIISIFIKKNNKFQISIVDYIFKNKLFIKIITALIVGLIIFEWYFIKILVYNNFLNIFDTIYEQLFVVIGVTFLIPGLIATIIYILINYCIMIINSEKQNFRND